MTTPKADMASDLAAFFNGDEFAESITYTPQGGAPKAIQAIIDRSPIRINAHGGQETPVNLTEIIIANDATLGVTAVKERFDTVALKLRLGDATDTSCRVTKILKQDQLTFTLEVAK